MDIVLGTINQLKLKLLLKNEIIMNYCQSWMERDILCHHHVHCWNLKLAVYGVSHGIYVLNALLSPNQAIKPQQSFFYLISMNVHKLWGLSLHVTMIC